MARALVAEMTLTEMEIILKPQAVAFNPRRDLPEQVAHPKVLTKFYSLRDIICGNYFQTSRSA